MDLCRHCRNITFKRSRASDLNSFAVHQSSGEALQKSAYNGCPLCSKLWMALCRENAIAYDLHDPPQSQGQEIAGDVCHDISCPVILRGMRNNYNYVRIICGEIEACIMGNGRGLVPGGLASHVFTFNPLTLLDILSDILPRAHVCPEGRRMPVSERSSRSLSNLTDDYTGSSVNLELAKTWIRDCSQGHDLCDTGFYQTPPILPSRVVCVSDPQNPYIFESRGICDQYTTLSYCWGHRTRLLTTKQTYEVFQTSLPTDDRMPLTFQDAFRVSEALGYKYVWIDALCIIQDDEQDVQKEMAMMGDIYQNSTVTIFAANGNTADSGPFAARNGLVNKPTTVVMTTDDNDRPETHEYTFLHPEYHAVNPLSTRGWVSTPPIPLSIRHSNHVLV
jgi:hypothetical protein